MPLEIRGALFISECTISARNTLRIGTAAERYDKAIKYSDKLVNSAVRHDTRATVAPLCGCGITSLCVHSNNSNITRFLFVPS